VFAEFDVELLGIDCKAARSQHGDANERLGVEEEQDAGDAVGKGLTGPGDEFLEPGQSLVLGE